MLSSIDLLSILTIFYHDISIEIYNLYIVLIFFSVSIKYPKLRFVPKISNLFIDRFEQNLQQNVCLE